MSVTRIALSQYENVLPGEPVLFGHIIEKVTRKCIRKRISEWATMENEKNGFPSVSLATVKECCSILQKRRTNTFGIEKFTQLCQKVAHINTNIPPASLRQSMSPTSSTCSTPSTSPANSTCSGSSFYSTPSSSPEYSKYSMRREGSILDEKVARKQREIRRLRNKIAIEKQKKRQLLKLKADQSKKQKDVKKRYNEEEISDKITKACLSNGVDACDVQNLVKSLLTTIKVHSG